MTRNSDPKGGIFLFYPHTYDGLFFSLVFILKKLLHVYKYAGMLHYMIRLFDLSFDSKVCELQLINSIQCMLDKV